MCTVCLSALRSFDLSDGTTCCTTSGLRRLRSPGQQHGGEHEPGEASPPNSPAPSLRAFEVIDAAKAAGARGRLPGQGLLRRRRRLRRPAATPAPPTQRGQGLKLANSIVSSPSVPQLKLANPPLYLGPRPKTSLFVLSWSLDYQITWLNLQSVFKLYEQYK